MNSSKHRQSVWAVQNTGSLYEQFKTQAVCMNSSKHRQSVWTVQNTGNLYEQFKTQATCMNSSKHRQPVWTVQNTDNLYEQFKTQVTCMNSSKHKSGNHKQRAGPQLWTQQSPQQRNHVMTVHNKYNHVMSVHNKYNHVMMVHNKYNHVMSVHNKYNHVMTVHNKYNHVMTVHIKYNHVTTVHSNATKSKTVKNKQVTKFPFHQITTDRNFAYPQTPPFPKAPDTCSFKGGRKSLKLRTQVWFPATLPDLTCLGAVYILCANKTITCRNELLLLLSLCSYDALSAPNNKNS